MGLELSGLVQNDDDRAYESQVAAEMEGRWVTPADDEYWDFVPEEEEHDGEPAELRAVR